MAVFGACGQAHQLRYKNEGNAVQEKVQILKNELKTVLSFFSQKTDYQLYKYTILNQKEPIFADTPCLSSKKNLLSLFKGMEIRIDNCFTFDP